MHCLFFDLGLALSRVVQQGHRGSSVKKYSAHNEHLLCPVAYLSLFVMAGDFSRSHNPLQICPKFKTPHHPEI